MIDSHNTAHRMAHIARPVARIVIAALYIVAGVFHIIRPEPFASITPAWVPWTGAVIFWTGIAELAGAAALIQPFSRSLRRAGAFGLALYALCVFPANINHFIIDMGKPDGGLGLAYHVPRMIAQPLLIALTLWAGEVIPRRPIKGNLRSR
jgi:uncharacterized membrane protein